MEEVSVSTNGNISLAVGDAIFISSGEVEGPEVVMSALNHLVTRNAITLVAKSPTVILLIKADVAKQIYTTAKASLDKDVNEFDIKKFKVMKMIGSGSYGKVFLCQNEANKHI